MGIFQDVLPNEAEYIVDNADVKMAIVEDQEQTDKLLDIKKDQGLNIQKIIVDDWKGLRNYQDPLLIKLTDVQKLGQKKQEISPGLFEKNISQGRGDDIAIISYTSGTTGSPKGVMLTYDNIMYMTSTLEEAIPANEKDRVITYLPLAWIVEMMISLCWYLEYGFIINFPESTETTQENIREIGPSILMAAPRIWERMCSEVQVKMMDSPWLKRKCYELCYSIGQKNIDRKKEKGGLGIWERLVDKLAYYLVFRSLQDRLGLSNIKHAFSKSKRHACTTACYEKKERKSIVSDCKSRCRGRYFSWC